MLPEVIERDIEEFVTDISGIEFNITYANKTKFKETYWVPSDDFKDLFAAIKGLVPETEYTPAVLLTSEDYEDEDDESQVGAKMVQSLKGSWICYFMNRHLCDELTVALRHYEVLVLLQLNK